MPASISSSPSCLSGQLTHLPMARYDLPTLFHQSNYGSTSFENGTFLATDRRSPPRMEAVPRSGGLKYESLLFDMDDTLYPMSSGLNLACRKNIEEFMLEQLHMEESQVPKMCLELYREYGTTMAGLKALGFEFDDDEFHACVHGKLPYEALKPDPVLRNLLLSMPQRKIILTNADKAHVARVLGRLGLEDCFEAVICFETLNSSSQADLRQRSDEEGNGDGMHDKDENPEHCGVLLTLKKTPILCKPAQEAIEAAIRIASVNPAKTIFFDDSARNIASGKAAGLHTVIVGSSSLVPGADYVLSSIHNIREALPELWEDGELEHPEQAAIQSATAETIVQA